MNLLTLFKGKLTYALSALAIVWGLVGWYFGWTDQTSALGVIWTGLTAFGIRRALPK